MKETPSANAADAYAKACRQVAAMEAANKHPILHIGVTTEDWESARLIAEYLKPYLAQAKKAATDFARSEVARTWQELESARKEETKKPTLKPVE